MATVVSTSRFNRSGMRGHQKAMYGFVKAKRRVLLLGQPGCGKTAPALHICADILAKVPGAQILWCSFKAPAYTVPATEAKKWQDTESLVFYRLDTDEGRQALLSAAAGIYLCNWERLPWITDNATSLKPFTAVIYDESSALRNPASRRTKLGAAIGRHSPFVVLMTGSPRPQHIGNLWSQLFIVNREVAGSYRHFLAEYTTVDHAGRTISQKDADKRLAEHVKGICIAFMTRDVIDLPPENHVVRWIELPSEVKAAMEEIEATLAARIEGETESGVVLTRSVRAVLVKLQQMTNGVVLTGLPDDPDRETILLHSEKLDSLERLLDELGGEPLLVFHNFRGMQREILRRFPDAEVLTPESMPELLPRFAKGDIRLLVGNPASIAHGIDGLQDCCHHCCFLEATFSVEKTEQAIARLLRSGQQHSVTIHWILAAGALDCDGEHAASLDELIYDLVRGRMSAQDAALRLMATRLYGVANVDDRIAELRARMATLRREMQITHPDRASGSADAFIKAKDMFDGVREELKDYEAWN